MGCEGMEKDKALIERIMREVWRVQYHHESGEWPDPQEVEAVKVVLKEEAVA